MTFFITKIQVMTTLNKTIKNTICNTFLIFYAMKKTIFLTIFTIFAIATNAQWSAGINIGAGIPVGDATEYTSTGLQWDLNGQYLITPKIGITANLGQSHFGDGETSYDYDYGNALAGGRYIGSANFTYQVSITTISLGANYYFAAPKNGLGYYAGLALAFNNASLKSKAIDEGRWYQDPINYTSYRNELTFEDSKGSGVGLIPRIGITYGFSGNWSARAEIGYHISGVKMSNEALDNIGLTVEEVNLNYVPFLIGVSYTF